MKLNTRVVAVSSLFASLLIMAAGCAQMGDAPAAKLKDGELAVPADYKQWPRFLSEIQRPDAKQVRDIYINPTGAAVRAGQPFPNGTVSVMEIYKARENSDGTLMKAPDGKLVKGDLAKVFVMGKNTGWGDTVTPAELKNGDWIYAAYKADATTPSGDPIGPCRSCHLPLVQKDFVHRYDEYFDKRASR